MSFVDGSTAMRTKPCVCIELEATPIADVGWRRMRFKKATINRSDSGSNGTYQRRERIIRNELQNLMESIG